MTYAVILTLLEASDTETCLLQLARWYVTHIPVIWENSLLSQTIIVFTINKNSST